jgi:hypothetical protein
MMPPMDEFRVILGSRSVLVKETGIVVPKEMLRLIYIERKPSFGLKNIRPVGHIYLVALFSSMVVRHTDKEALCN